MFELVPHLTFGQVTQYVVSFQGKTVNVGMLVSAVLNTYKNTNIKVRMLAKDVAFVEMDKGCVVFSELKDECKSRIVKGCYAVGFQNTLTFVVDKGIGYLDED